MGAFVGIVWYPSTVEIYCDGGAAAPAAEEPKADEAAPAEEPKAEGEEPVATITLSPEQMRRIAAHPATLAWARQISAQKAAELEMAIADFGHRNVQVAKTGTSATY